ncbi:Argonaute complex, subunit Arb1 [Chaetomidium leptoderma]|uniref:Argonaute complex, subunit Arb1 n=1 Tax=Chaetomidium leptoderma TaxID=669021 RepID=A0AAN6VC43_9PEZI|nr:Argonaute complex, subunit Arb1 [Chaetomidium leptoderma]
MTSPQESSSAPLEGTQKDAPVDGKSQQVDIGKVRVEDDKPQDGKKKKRGNKRGAGAKKRGTGFEEFFCDPPMTPAEYNEEKDVIYPPHRPFADRIEECIQRFRARRNMGPERDALFSRYLLLGGIDATVRQFQGTRNIGDDILEDATKSAVREMTADDVIQRGGDGNRNPRFYNPNYPEHWDVDFTGVAAGFVSENLPRMVGSDVASFRIGVDVVLNFLKYVDRHDVCPEYADDVKNAQRVCLRALEEIPAITQLLELVPGQFNTALGVLHVKKDDHCDSYSAETLLDTKQAKISHAATISILLEPKSFPVGMEWSVTDTAESTFEILTIELPVEATRAKYKAINQHLTAQADIQPCGTITARPVVIRDGWDNTMAATILPEADVESQFILEEDILQLLRVGMKLTMGVCTLNVGLKFIKYFKEIRPSFYAYLPQELMFQYKEPVMNDRPAPSIHDCDEEEDVLAGVPIGARDE